MSAISGSTRVIASAAAAAGAGAGAAAVSVTAETLAYPLALPLVTVCSEYLAEDPRAVCGLWETMQAAISVEARAGYCFGAYVTRRLQNSVGLTELSKWKFVIETVAYATRRMDFALFERALGTLHQNDSLRAQWLCPLDEHSSTARGVSYNRIATYERCVLKQLDFLEGRQRFLAFEHFLSRLEEESFRLFNRIQGGAWTKEELSFHVAVRYLEDSHFTASLLSSASCRIRGERYVKLIGAMSIAATCRGLPAFVIPPSSHTPMPEGVPKAVNEVLGAASLPLRERIERLHAIFKPSISQPLPLSDLYVFPSILRALLQEGLVEDMGSLQGAVVRDPRLEVMEILSAHSPFMAFASALPKERGLCDLEDVSRIAEQTNEWRVMAYAIQLAEARQDTTNRIHVEALRWAVQRGNTEALSVLMEHKFFINMGLRDICTVASEAVGTGCIDTTFLLLHSPQVQQASVEDFAKFLSSLPLERSHPEMLKMFLEDARILEFNKVQLLTVIMPLLKEKQGVALFKLFVEHPVFNKVFTKTGLFFRQIQTVEHFAILKATGCMEELAIQVVYEKMRSLIDQSAVAFLQDLFLTSQFSKFEVGQLNALYGAIVAKRDPKLLTAFMASSRFKDIDALTLGQELVKAVRMGSRELVEIMVKSPHLHKKLSAESRTDALLEAGKLQNGKEDMVALLTLLVPA